MLLFLSYFGETAPMEAPEGITVGEFKQLLQHQTGVPVADQSVEGLAPGTTDRSDIGDALTDGATVTLSVRDREEEERASEAAARQLLADDEVGDLHEAHALEGGGYAAAGGAHGGAFADVGHPMHPQHEHGRSVSAMPEILRALVTPLASEASGDASVAPIRVDDSSASSAEKRQHVDTGLAQSLAQLVWTQFSPCPSFSHAVSESRRARVPVLAVLYDVHDFHSASLLGALTNLHSCPDTRAIFSNFVLWVCNVRQPDYEAFLDVLQNNSELQESMHAKVLGQDVALPLVTTLVPVGASMQVGSVLHTMVEQDALVAALVHVIAEHSERLDEERGLNEALSGDRQIREEQDEALALAMQQDREAEAARAASERAAAQAAAEAER
eukprot:Rhum_TRINITY_DN14733_c14_g1::Rhum_TRINITY_DN14733_c14_g1_i1::g.113104::m.113104